MKLMKQITKTLAGIKTIFYLWVSIWVIKLKRILAPLQAVMFSSKRVSHMLHLCLGCFILFKCPSQDYQKTKGQNLVQKSATRVQKAVVSAMSYQPSPINVLTVTNWPLIPAMVNTIGMPLQDGDAKRNSKAKFRQSLCFGFLNISNIREKPFYILCHE